MIEPFGLYGLWLRVAYFLLGHFRTDDVYLIIDLALALLNGRTAPLLVLPCCRHFGIL